MHGTFCGRVFPTFSCSAPAQGNGKRYRNPPQTPERFQLCRPAYRAAARRPASPSSGEADGAERPRGSPRRRPGPAPPRPVAPRSGFPRRLPRRARSAAPRSGFPRWPAPAPPRGSGFSRCYRDPQDGNAGAARRGGGPGDLKH